MKQKKLHGSESVKIKIKDDKVTIVFNAQNWDYICTQLLIAVARHAEDRDIPVANLMKESLKLKLLEISPSKESFDRFMHLCERLAAAEESGKYTSGIDKPDIGEPK